MGTHPIFESDFDCLTDMDDFGLKIGESSTFPTDIYLKVRGKKLRAVRTTDLEKLTIEEIKDLSREILIQRKLRSPYIVEVLSCRVMGLTCLSKPATALTAPVEIFYTRIFI